MPAKYQDLKFIVDAITKVKSEISQDDKNNPVLSETLKVMEKKLLDRLYEENKSQVEKQEKASKAKPGPQKKHTPAAEQKDSHNGIKS